MLMNCHLELRVFAVNPPTPQEAITIHTFEERRCESEQQQLRWNATLINLPPWSHWMCLLPPTQPAINRLLKGSPNALFWRYVWSSSKPTEYQKVTANVLVFCNCYITLTRIYEKSVFSEPNIETLCLTCVQPITGHNWVCLLLQEAKLVASSSERKG